jgi:hypothetical protein
VVSTSGRTPVLALQSGAEVNRTLHNLWPSARVPTQRQ